MSAIKNMKIGHRLTGLAILSAAFTLAVGLLGLFNASKINDMLNSMYDNNLVPIADVANANMQAIYHNRALYDYVIEQDTANMDRIAAGMKTFEAKKTELLDTYRKTQLTDKEVDALRRFDALWPGYLAAADKVMKQSHAGNNTEAMKLMEGEATPSFQKVDDILSELVTINQALGKQAYDDSDAVVARARNLSAALIVVAIGLSLGLALWVSRGITGALAQAGAAASRIRAGDLTQPIEVTSQDETGQLLAAMRDMQANLASVVGQVRGNAESVATASAQIAQGNSDLSQRTEQQASALQQTAATMTEVGTTVKNNADNARQANQLAQSASTVAQQGGAVVGEVVQTMKGINDSSRRIAEIIGTIDGIAFQTNILALNAAVEAARAGEQGRGFAVVAGEVRTLAQRSAEAAREIKALIGASVERVEQGSALVDKAGATMDEVVASIRRVTDIVGEITSASAEQATGVGQVGEAITQMDRVTQQNAALVEESAAAAESLKGQAKQLVEAVSVFRVAT